MKTYLLTAAALGLAAAGLTTLGSTPAKAGAVCLTDNDSPTTFNSCEFRSYASCQAYAVGVGGSCVNNPDYYGPEGRYGYVPSAEFGMAYNRYDGPIYRRGYSADRW